MESEEPEIKSKQTSKRDRTLLTLLGFHLSFLGPDVSMSNFGPFCPNKQRQASEMAHVQTQMTRDHFWL